MLQKDNITWKVPYRITRFINELYGIITNYY